MNLERLRCVPHNSDVIALAADPKQAERQSGAYQEPKEK